MATSTATANSNKIGEESPSPEVSPIHPSLLKDPDVQRSMSQPTHKAMLFILESIIRSPLTVDDLMVKLAKPCYSETRKACKGDNSSTLEAFIRANSSVFSIDADGLIRPTELLQVEAESSPTVDSTTPALARKPLQTGSFTLARPRSDQQPQPSSLVSSTEKKNNNNKTYQPPCARRQTSSTTPSGFPLRVRRSLLEETNQNVTSTEMQSADRLELEAVAYFEGCLARKPERWVPIKSLAGHQSQASESIRAVVGNQSDFENFLLKHPQAFEVQGTLVSLKRAGNNNANRLSLILTNHHQQQSSPAAGTPVPRLRGGQNTLRGRQQRPISLVMLSPQPYDQNFVDSTARNGPPLSATISSRRKTNKNTNGVVQAEGICLQITPKEYQTIMYLRKILAKYPKGLAMTRLMSMLADKAPDVVQETIGLTEVELEGFLDLKADFFETTPDPLELHQRVVMNRRFSKKINLVIVGGQSAENNPSMARTMVNRCGRVAHVAKQWGIIDLGKHEHVFFDKSIFRNVDDLQKHFCIDDVLYFNAILAAKESRAKWRATQVWRECDKRHLNGPGVVSSMSRYHNNSHQLKRMNSNSHTCNLDEDDFEQPSFADGGQPLFSTESLCDEQTEYEGEMDEIDVLGAHFSDFSFSEGYFEDLTLEMNQFYEDGPLDPARRRFRVDEFLTVCNDELLALGDEEEFSSSSNSFSNTNNNNNGSTFSSESARQQTGQITSTNSSANAAKSNRDLVSVGVQTLSTGDIMAKQLYHMDE